MYVAGKLQKIQRNGKTIELQPGDPFPEAEGASVLRALINTGYVVWQSGDKPGNVHDDAMVTEAMVRGTEKGLAKKSKVKKAEEIQAE